MIEGGRVERWLLRLTFAAVAWPILSVLFLILGLLSLKRLGKALEETGRNFQKYDW